MNRAKIFIVFTFLLAFAVGVSAQINKFPNELKGYEFFGKGKLKGLIIGTSTKEDVKKIFGDYCHLSCDYDEKWTVHFSHFSNDTGIQVKDRLIFPKEEFEGRIWSISLVPKTGISFQKTKFPKTFKLFIGYNEGCGTGADCTRSPKLKFYQSLHKLTYITHKDSGDNYKKDDLYEIRYDISEELESQVFELEAK